MSEKQLLIKINAEDKYCGKCYLKDIKSDDSCGIYYECILFDELVKSDYSFEKNERCRACLDAEKKAKEIEEELKELEEFVEDGYREYIDSKIAQWQEELKAKNKILRKAGIIK